MLTNTDLEQCLISNCQDKLPCHDSICKVASQSFPQKPLIIEKYGALIPPIRKKKKTGGRAAKKEKNACVLGTLAMVTKRNVGVGRKVLSAWLEEEL